jgi:ABC-type lipoprotein release transport system permease subunit
MWLARRNFSRGASLNLAPIVIVTVNCLAFFAWYLYRFLPNPVFSGEKTEAFAAVEFFLIVCLCMNFLSLFVIFWLVNRARYHEIGLLRGIGARRMYIFKLLLMETQFMVLCSAVLAIVLGFVLAILQGEMLQPFFGNLTGGGAFLRGVLAAFAAIASTAVTAALAVLYPAFVACRIEPYNALRNRD